MATDLVVSDHRRQLLRTSCVSGEQTSQCAVPPVQGRALPRRPVHL